MICRNKLYFETIGFQLIGRYPGTKKGRERLFTSWFGTHPVVCAYIWSMFVRTNALIHPPAQRVLPEYLLMAMYFLKTYNTVDKGSTDFGCDTKTYRQWTWYFVELIANLDKQIVSTEK